MEKYVEIKRDELILRGMLHIPEDISKKVPMVIILHGFADDRNEINFVHNELSRRLCEEGIASVRFDMNGSGESDGTFENMTISSEILDVYAMLDFVKGLDFVDTNRIALHGCSLGGCVASMVAGRKKEDIRALSMWCPAPDLVYNLQEHMTLCGQDVSDIVERGCADVEGLRFGLSFYNDALTLDPYKDAAQFDKNVNTVHGDLDITASCDCSYRYKEIYGDRANLLIVKGSEHRFKSFEFREARMSSAIDFLKRELL
ncbi:MAG: alpha/beta fold hydrolase [Bacillota bacterium]|nr:alpha/beta fold hydrolase [Bacillota bacterium]